MQQKRSKYSTLEELLLDKCERCKKLTNNPITSTTIYTCTIDDKISDTIETNIYCLKCYNYLYIPPK